MRGRIPGSRSPRPRPNRNRRGIAERPWPRYRRRNGRRRKNLPKRKSAGRSGPGRPPARPPLPPPERNSHRWPFPIARRPPTGPRRPLPRKRRRSSPAGAPRRRVRFRQAPFHQVPLRRFPLRRFPLFQVQWRRDPSRREFPRRARPLAPSLREAAGLLRRRGLPSIRSRGAPPAVPGSVRTLPRRAFRKAPPGWTFPPAPGRNGPMGTP